MQLQPSKSHVLVRFYQPEQELIKPSASVFEAPRENYRTRVEVLAVGPDVKACKTGEFLLLIPKPIAVPIDSEKNEFLIHEDAVLGIILDDKAPA